MSLTEPLCSDCDSDWVCDRHRPMGPFMTRDIEHRVNLTHYCPVCKRVLPFAPGVTRRAFVTIGVAHVCLTGTTRFHKWYEPDEQAANLEELLDGLEPTPESPPEFKHRPDCRCGRLNECVCGLACECARWVGPHGL